MMNRQTIVDHRQRHVGKLLAEDELQPRHRRDVEVDDRAELLLAHHRQRHQDRRDQRQQHGDGGGHHGVDAVEILVVAEPRLDRRRRHGGAGAALLRQIGEVAAVHALQIAADGLGAERHGAVDPGADLGRRGCGARRGRSRRDLDRDLQLAFGQTAVPAPRNRPAAAARRNSTSREMPRGRRGFPASGRGRARRRPGGRRRWRCRSRTPASGRRCRTARSRSRTGSRSSSSAFADGIGQQAAQAEQRAVGPRRPGCGGPLLSRRAARRCAGGLFQVGDERVLQVVGVRARRPGPRGGRWPARGRHPSARCGRSAPPRS